MKEFEVEKLLLKRRSDIANRQNKNRDVNRKGNAGAYKNNQNLAEALKFRKTIETTRGSTRSE